jgi:hypothetical protein
MLSWVITSAAEFVEKRAVDPCNGDELMEPTKEADEWKRKVD